MAKRGSKNPPPPDLPTDRLGPDLRVLVLTGKEAFLREAHVQRLREKLLEAGENPEIFRFDGAEHEPADVYDECRSFSLMGGYKLVIVENADQLVSGDNRDLAIRYVQHPTDSVTLVLRTDSWNRGKHLDEPILKVGGFIQCEELTPQRAAGWTKKRAGRFGADIEPEAQVMLVERVGVGLVKLASEVDKLAALVGDGGVITADHVRELVGRSREEEVWAIQEPLLRADTHGSLALLNELLSVGAGAPTVLVRWAYTDLARKLHIVARSVADGKPPREGAKAAKAWGAGLEPLARAGAALDQHRAAELLRAAVETDFRGKTSQTDERTALEALSVRFCDTLRSPAARR